MSPEQPSNEQQPFNQPQPTTEPAVFNPPQQFAPEPTQSPQTHPATASTYESNPFLISIRGLILMLKVNPVSIMLSGLVGFILLIVFALLMLAVSAVARDASAVVNVLTFLALPVGGVLIMGSSYAIAARSAREESITVGESYGIAFRRFFGALGLGLICAVLFLLSSLLLILPGLYFLSRASLAFFVLYEEKLGPIKALKRSFELTKGHAMEMFGAMVASNFLSGGGGGLLSFAIALSPLAGRYYDLRELKESGAEKPKVHYLNWLISILLVLFVAGYVGFIVFVTKSAFNNAAGAGSFSSSSNFDTNTTLDPFSSSSTFSN